MRLPERRLDKRKLIVVMVAAMVSLTVRPTQAADRMVEKSLSYFPAHINSLMVMNVEQIKESERAKQAGWSDENSSMWIAGTEPLPPWVEVIVRGAHTHLGRSSREWSMSVAEAPEYMNFSDLARHSGQKTQTVAGQLSYLASSGAYVSMLNQDTIGVLRPADRAGLSRWINQVQSGSDPVLPEYLQRVAQQSGHILLAVDLTDTFDKWLLRTWLESTETLKGSTTRVLEMAELLQHLEGLILTVDVTDDIHAKLRFDFDTSLSPVAEHFHPLLLEYLNHSRAFVSDLESAKVELQGSTVVMTMSSLSNSGFQRLMSLILSPHPQQPLVDKEGGNSEQTNKDSPASRLGPNLETTRKYYLAIDSLLGDLEKSYKRSRNYEATAVWHERFAQKISHLPIERVDPAMVEYGLKTSSRLVALAASLRGQPLEINALNNAITYNVQPTYGGNGWWGAPVTTSGTVPAGYNVNSNLAEVREKQAQAVIEGNEERQQVWQLQLDARNEIRSEMYQKYEVDLGSGSSDREE